eukprot:Blabericola_migrator_1__5469@NODE_2795_length_2342_cov_156_509890_g60_i1_p1_GENE_NODE_2795_length_2342_cov_156_509890_g60_i1NODE_2795_length_2342_cov_156_509890_g60_i1_p1_ORF_typecomplete_len176_score15_90Rhomboid/PF01694_22/1_3e03Rhomboid/PF01694_22/1e06PMT_4TMC/PF16192_5/0_0073_NODE_2795_length_2342_cov_156_509890_g60_i18521379
MDVFSDLPFVLGGKLDPLPWGGDMKWGIFEAEAPTFVIYTMRTAVIWWAIIYAVEVLAASALCGDFVTTVSPRVALAMGCLYRHIDPWYRMVPRMVTCGFLHYNLQHVFMNVMGVGTSIILFQRALNELDNASWVWYYPFTIWLTGTLAGSALSYTAKLGRNGSFTVGASGGCYA